MQSCVFVSRVVRRELLVSRALLPLCSTTLALHSVVVILWLPQRLRQELEVVAHERHAQELLELRRMQAAEDEQRSFDDKFFGLDMFQLQQQRAQQCVWCAWLCLAHVPCAVDGCHAVMKWSHGKACTVLLFAHTPMLCHCCVWDGAQTRVGAHVGRGRLVTSLS